MSLDDWAGVTATDAGTLDDNSDDIVTELIITRGYLHGELPPEIGNLTSLIKLDLSSNRAFRDGGRYLRGTIPPEIGKLTNLQELILYRTNVTGPLPSELGDLASLTKLKIYESKLSGSIPPELGKLTNLQELELHRNGLTGSIPGNLGNLGSLTRLTLDRNNLTGSIPGELGNLGNPDPSDPNSSSVLDRLDLSENSLSGPIPPELGKLGGLTALWLQINNLSGQVSPELGQMSNLGQMFIFNNQLSGPIPVELFSMGKLHTLDLRNNRIDGEIPAPPSDFMFLDLDDNMMKSQQLSHLYLQNNQLSGSIPPEIKNLARLKWVNLDYNQLTGDIPPELNSTNLIYLSRLRLRGNQLTGTIPTELGNLDPSSLDSLSTDVVIDLSRNQLTGDIPAGLWDMPKLEELHLNDNQLTWTTLPTDTQLEALTKLEQLYLNNNQLEGEIPLAGLETLTVDDSDPPEPTTTFRELALWGNPGLELPSGQRMSAGLLKRVDRAVLRALYEGTNGLNWERRSKFISSFSGSYTWFGTQAYVENDPIFNFWRLPGVTVNSDGRVAGLDLSNNNLEGEITNGLSELGGLQTLDLSGNASLRGTLPQSLMDSSELETLNIQCTGISTPADMDFQTWLGTINFTGSRCPSFRSPAPPAPPEDIEELEVFYLETGGENWTDNTNWLSENQPLSQWRGVTANDEGRVTALDLSGNGLSGSVPPSLGYSVSELETLDLSDNPMLSGMLPLSLMNLSELEALNIEGTGACAPEDAAFQQWLTTIDFQGDICVLEEDMDVDVMVVDNGACAIAGIGNTPESTIFNLFLIMSILIAISWQNPSRLKRTQT